MRYTENLGRLLTDRPCEIAPATFISLDIILPNPDKGSLEEKRYNVDFVLR